MKYILYLLLAVMGLAVGIYVQQHYRYTDTELVGGRGTINLVTHYTNVYVVEDNQWMYASKLTVSEEGMSGVDVVIRRDHE